MKTHAITADRVRELLDYNRETGVFVWRAGARAGRAAGTRHHSGYRFIKVDQVVHLAHRLAWLYVTGEIASSDLDHKNRDKADNRFDNLRLCDDSTNQANTSISKRNTSGHKGVCWNAKAGKWQAGIKRGGRSHHLGLFSEVSAASAAYRAASQMHFGQFARAA